SPEGTCSSTASGAMRRRCSSSIRLQRASSQRSRSRCARGSIRIQRLRPRTNPGDRSPPASRGTARAHASSWRPPSPTGSSVPLDLRVIDTAGMVELARTAAASTALWLAPDGSSLLYGSERWDSTAEGYATRSEWTLHLADGASARERASFPAGGTAWLASFNRDSAIADAALTAIGGGTLA